MVHMCKMIISPGMFLISQNFDFPGCQGVKGQKMSQNDKCLSVAPYISGIIYHMIFIYGAHL